jgi:biotin-(acetyl-CoA carboxylase) ligase
MVGGRKLGGILAETVAAGAPDPGTAVVVGLGLNVGWPPPDGAADPAADPAADAGANTKPDVVPAAPPTSPASSGTDDDASLAAERARLLALSTSLRRETGEAVEPLTVLGLVLEELEGRLVELAEGGGRRRLASEYRRRCVTVGQDVRVSLPGEDFTGTASDITAEGHLIVDVGTCFRTVAAGDVVHLRDGG